MRPVTVSPQAQVAAIKLRIVVANQNRAALSYRIAQVERDQRRYESAIQFQLLAARDAAVARGMMGAIE